MRQLPTEADRLDIRLTHLQLMLDKRRARDQSYFQLGRWVHVARDESAEWHAWLDHVTKWCRQLEGSVGPLRHLQQAASIIRLRQQVFARFGQPRAA